MVARVKSRRPWTFYVLATVFTLFVLFLYGPMACIYILSFQGPNGGLTFPLNGVSTHWFGALFHQERTGDIAGALSRSIGLAIIVMALTVIFSLAAGLAFRRRFIGATFIFYVAVASLIVPGLVLSVGIGLIFQMLGIPPRWYSSALGAHLSWTLPFGLLIMFAVFSRLSPSYEEAARDLGRRQARPRPPRAWRRSPGRVPRPAAGTSAGRSSRAARTTSRTRWRPSGRRP